MSNKVHRRRFLSQTAAVAAVWTAAAKTPCRALAANDSWGDLTGRLVYDGAAPERERLVVDKDVDCCGKFDIRDESLMVGADGGLMNVYVYLRSKVRAIPPELQKTVEKQVLLDNRDCIFIPHCMKIWNSRQEFYIKNSDPVAQNVAFSPDLDQPANIVIPVDTDATWKFNRPQRKPVPIACNYHPWESAYILPVDHPYVAITSDDGTFTIRRLPLGELEFQFWHERTDFLETRDWPRGRLTVAIRAGLNDLGTIKLPPVLFAKK
ncbi:MAG: hypothetical protein GXY25_05725 [Pirellulaceae bacterium]|nr:hypothetical protein [Pirellulaceae bacterium]